MKKKKVLLLNADYLPFDIISWRRGLKKVLSEDLDETAYIVEIYDETIKDSMGRIYDLPAVIALKKFRPVNHKTAKYSKINVFCRDKFTCQYCGKVASRENLTVDHVIPRSKWDILGRKDISVSSFENVVAACKKCNTAKGDKLSQECGMKLLSIPRNVTMHEAFINRCLYEECNPEWEPYLESIANVKKTH